MYKNIYHNVKSCPSSLSGKPNNQAPGLTIPDELPDPIEKVNLDYFGPVSCSKRGNYQYMAVYVDAATRFVIAKPMKIADAKTLLEFIVVLVHGCPEVICFDNASINRSLLTQHT